MVRKKHKSKRTTLKQKYKVEKKVKQHHKKMKRLAKAGMGQRKKNKDPGVPNLWPFKEQLLLKAKHQKKMLEANAAAQKKRRRELKKARRAAALAGNDAEAHKAMEMAAFMRGAQKKSAEFELAKAEREAMEASGMGVAKMDSSRKAFYRDLRRVVEESDVLLEVLDARDPLGTRIKSVEDLVATQYPNKRIVLVLNKIDLVPKDVIESWMTYLRAQYPVILFKSSTKKQSSNLSRSSVQAMSASSKLKGTTEALGVEALMSLVKNFSRSGNIKKSIIVGVIGQPNVGKSSLVNTLKREKACKSGAQAGVTRTTQLIKLDSKVRLIDSPGVVTAKATEAELVLRSAINVQQVEDPVGAVEAILDMVSPEHLMYVYQCARFDTVDGFLAQVAERFGHMKRGHIPNMSAAALHVVKDWCSGQIPYYTLPPADGLAQGSQVSASIVSAYGEQFSLDDAFADGQTALLNAAARPTSAGQSFAVVSSSATEGGDMAWGDSDASDDEGYSSSGAGMDLERKPSKPRVGVSTNELRRRTAKSLAKATHQSDSDDSGDAAMATMAARANKQVNRDRKRAMKQAKKKQGYISSAPSSKAARAAAAAKAMRHASDSDASDSPADANDNYSFATDFTAASVLDQGASSSDSDDDAAARHREILQTMRETATAPAGPMLAAALASDSDSDDESSSDDNRMY